LPHEKTKTKTFPTREKTKTLNKAFQLEDKVSRSWGKREGEPSAEVCDRLSRTRVSSQRQLPTDHDYAVPTREYQLDQSSPLPASAAADPALVRKNNQRTLTGHYISTSVYDIVGSSQEIFDKGSPLVAGAVSRAPFFGVHLDP